MSNSFKTRPDVSVVIPVYNEGGNIRPLTNEVFDALAGRINYELIYVDDGSVDDTPDEIERIIMQNPVVSICRHDRNRGQSAAVRTGVTAARAGIVAVLDGDGQNDPGDILRLYGQLSMVPSLSMVIGERREPKDGWLRGASARIENRVRSWLLGDGISDKEAECISCRSVTDREFKGYRNTASAAASGWELWICSAFAGCRGGGCSSCRQVMLAATGASHE